MRHDRCASAYAMFHLYPDVTVLLAVDIMPLPPVADLLTFHVFLLQQDDLEY